MLLYENLSNNLIRIKLEPEKFTKSIYTKNIDTKLEKVYGDILLNYFIPEYEMDIYVELTNENKNAFVETDSYTLPSEKWYIVKLIKK